MVKIEPFVAARDTGALFTLWETTIGAPWPLTAAQFGRVIGSTAPASGRALFIAREGPVVAGFVATQIVQPDPHSPLEGYILALAVAPVARNHGIGTALHDHALVCLRECGARRVQLGGGAPRIWPGVPRDLPVAIAFFQRRGWDFAETSHDLVRDLRAEWSIRQPLRPLEGIDIVVTTASEVPKLLAFERHEFPSWQGAYAQIAQLGDHADFLIARRAGGTIVGALILFTPLSHPQRSDVLWTRLLGDDCGGLGAVGVAADERGKGIGSALVSRGSEVLCARGVGNCCIGWTWLIDFYGRLGYRPWRSYAMGWREL